MPRSTAPRLRDRGHEAVDVRDIGLGAADDRVIALYARENGLCLVTRDKDFGDIQNYPPADYAGIVVFDLPDDTVVTGVLKILDTFLSQTEWLERLPGRLAIVEPARVRFRPS